jgi:hypothetical protein
MLLKQMGLPAGLLSAAAHVRLFLTELLLKCLHPQFLQHLQATKSVTKLHISCCFISQIKASKEMGGGSYHIVIYNKPAFWGFLGKFN